jgi:hypothetical protein
MGMLDRVGCTALGALFLLGACTHEADVPEAEPVTEVAEAPAPETETFAIRLFDKTIGELTATTEGDTVTVDYEYRNNGRGPTLAETIVLGEDGLPVGWTVDGATTFGNEIHETFALEDGTASWTDTTGPGTAGKPANRPSTSRRTARPMRWRSMRRPCWPMQTTSCPPGLPGSCRSTRWKA